MQWFDCHHLDYQFREYALFHSLCTVQQHWSQLGTICEQCSPMTLPTPSEIWKRYTVSIHAGSSNMKISLCLGVNLRTGQNSKRVG